MPGEATEPGPRAAPGDRTERRSLHGPMVGVLALQGDFADHILALRRVGAQAFPVRRRSELGAADALVVPGGESTVLHKLAIREGLFLAIRQKISDGLPVLGSCAGMIMLADHLLGGIDGQETFGGVDMTVRRNAFGRQVASFEAPVVFEGIDGPLPGVFIRAPWVEAVGAKADALGHVVVADGQVRTVAVRQGPLLATAFHPELTEDSRLHSYFLDIVREVKRAKSGWHASGGTGAAASTVAAQA